MGYGDQLGGGWGVYYEVRFFGNKCSAFNVVKSYINLSLIFASPYLRLLRRFTGGLSLSGGVFGKQMLCIGSAESSIST